jgi:NAD(P)-dependent dehydrogenase (short-subunit alcohol dehydrogenase family)
MKLDGISAIVTGAASGLGLATATRLVEGGASVTLVDLPSSAGAEVAAELGACAQFIAGDVTDEQAISAALDLAEQFGPVRVAVHCAGIGTPVRLVDRDGSAGSLEAYSNVIKVNLIGSFNVLRLAAARMAKNEPLDGDRGVCVMTASVAAFEGQIGQIAYSASKGGVHAMTIVAARDLAGKQIRVCTIAPGLFDTPLLAALPEPIKESLGKSVPHPSRLGTPAEYAQLAQQIIENPMLNGETIRLDGAIRMAPR